MKKVDLEIILLRNAKFLRNEGIINVFTSITSENKEIVFKLINGRINGLIIKQPHEEEHIRAGGRVSEIIEYLEKQIILSETNDNEMIDMIEHGIIEEDIDKFTFEVNNYFQKVSQKNDTINSYIFEVSILKNSRFEGVNNNSPTGLDLSPIYSYTYNRQLELFEISYSSFEILHLFTR